LLPDEVEGETMSRRSTGTGRGKRSGGRHCSNRMGQQLRDQRCSYGRMAETGGLRSVVSQVCRLLSSVAGLIACEVEKMRLRALGRVDRAPGPLQYTRHDENIPEQMQPVDDTKKIGLDEKP